MADELYKPLLNRIDEKLQRSFSIDSSGSSIFKVPNQLRQTNEKAYEPHIMSIGPYHRGKDHLKPMEEHKIHYLKRLLRRRNENSVARYVLALKAMEEKMRKCYAEPLDHIDEEAFIEMMLLDGCFIVELIRRETGEYSRQENECVCGNSNMMISLTRDLLLVENQLPLFMLLELFQMTQMHDQDSDFVHLAIDFFSEMMPGPRIQHRLISSDRNIKNLLGLVHDCWLPSLDAIDRYVSTSAEYGEWNFIRTATELVEAGIDFKNVSKNVGRSMFDIKFEKGVLWIPTIRMEDNTDSILRNLIAYEQCHNDIYPRYVTDYVTFMDCLINSKKDVELLCRSGVIENWLGDDRAVATVFNKLGESVVLLDDNFYSQIFIKVRNHCNRKWNIWMANLRHNYFNTPWALISFIAAVFLLILTVIQTLYTVLQYYQQ